MTEWNDKLLNARYGLNLQFIVILIDWYYSHCKLEGTPCHLYVHTHCIQIFYYPALISIATDLLYCKDCRYSTNLEEKKGR